MSMKRMLPGLALVLLTLGGCAQHPYGADMRASIDAPYRLSSGDRVRIIVFGQENLTNSFNVDGAGNIAMPLIGSVHVQNLTTAEAASTLEARLRGGYLREPKVSVEVEAFRPFFVLGEVGSSGQYPFVNGMTAQTAVAIAGGFSPRGDQSGVDVTRSIDGRATTASVPMTFAIRPGDTITVRERFF
ncbi:MAG: polysaccharide export protein [Pseudomonadota bacterium]|nr:polysaccharide export protein [Pseudomonadota bacterium]